MTKHTNWQKQTTETNNARKKGPWTPWKPGPQCENTVPARGQLWLWCANLTQGHLLFWAGARDAEPALPRRAGWAWSICCVSSERNSGRLWIQVPPCLTCHPQDTETHETQHSFVDVSLLYCASNSAAPRKQTKSDSVTRKRHFPRGPAGPSPQSHCSARGWIQVSSPQRPQAARAPCTASALTALCPVSQRHSRAEAGQQF